MRRITPIVFALLCPLQASAAGIDDAYPDVKTETPLSNAELEIVFKGQKHLGTYNFLMKDITSFAFEETTRADGGVRHVQQGQVDTGEWKITKDTICYDYDNPSFTKACFQIYARGNCYYHYHVSIKDHYGSFGFTARSVIAGDTPNCEPNLV